MKVLIVDDSQMICKIITDIIMKAGHYSIYARNGKEGLNLLEKYNDIDVIISDWSMPTMNGMDFLRIIKKSQHKNIPFYFLSANVTKNDKKKHIVKGQTDISKSLLLLIIL